MEDVSDYQLMERIRSGDASAFADLVRRHQTSLVNFFRRLGAYNDMEDLAQEVFVRVYRYREKYRPRAPTVVVTPTRSEQDSAALPFAISDYSAGDIQLRKMSRTTPEILDDTPSVMVQKTGHGQGSPFIRGFTGFRTLFLIDGIRLNNSVFRDGPNQYWNTVDPFSIYQLEVIRGPGSVMYGSDAVGGTVNALTRSPLDEDEPGLGGRAHYRYSSAEDSHIVRGEAHGVDEDRAAFTAGGTYKHFGDLKTGSDAGRLSKTGYDEYDFDAKIQYMLAEDLRLTLAHQTVLRSPKCL